MIRYVRGDILLSECTMVAHCLSTRNTFDFGLARSISESWPSMRQAYEQDFSAGRINAGDVWVWHSPCGIALAGLVLFSPVAGMSQRSKAGLMIELDKALHYLGDSVRSVPCRNIAIPRVGVTGFGLPWKAVKTLIEKNLGDIGVNIDVYERHIRARPVDSIYP